jgi:hypothetical protein
MGKTGQPSREGPECAVEIKGKYRFVGLWGLPEAIDKTTDKVVMVIKTKDQKNNFFTDFLPSSVGIMIQNVIIFGNQDIVVEGCVSND